MKGDYGNGTVDASVRSNLTAVMGRMAGYRQGEVTWKELIASTEPRAQSHRTQVLIEIARTGEV